MDHFVKSGHKFTVFTPTYNRGYVLRRAFESLQRQTFKDFEWVVVDDGSTDNTRVLVADLAQKALFPVRYFYQTHGHKKKAINYGVREARGELFVFLDNDLNRFDFESKFFLQCFQHLGCFITAVFVHQQILRHSKS